MYAGRLSIYDTYKKHKDVYKSMPNAFSRARVATENENGIENDFELDNENEFVHEHEYEFDNDHEHEIENEHEHEIENELEHEHEIENDSNSN